MSQVPYLWSQATGLFSTYEDERSVGLKAQYAEARGLGGVMFWESSADAPTGEGSLVEAAFRVFNPQS